jgi:hypothetical protein
VIIWVARDGDQMQGKEVLASHGEGAVDTPSNHGPLPHHYIDSICTPAELGVEWGIIIVSTHALTSKRKPDTRPWILSEKSVRDREEDA